MARHSKSRRRRHSRPAPARRHSKPGKHPKHHHAPVRPRHHHEPRKHHAPASPKRGHVPIRRTGPVRGSAATVETPHKGGGGAGGINPSSSAGSDLWNQTHEGVKLIRAYNSVVDLHHESLPVIRYGFNLLMRRRLV